MAVEFLTDEQAARYGAFNGAPSRVELERYFFLDDADLELVRGKRRTHNRLGFAEVRNVLAPSRSASGHVEVQGPVEHLVEREVPLDEVLDCLAAGPATTPAGC